MVDAGTGAHDLDLAFVQNRHVAHAVAVFEPAPERNADDLHVAVGVHAETRSRCDAVVIENPQRAEMDPLGIVIIRKTEGVCGLEPAVVEIAAGVCFVNDSFHN